MANNDSPSVSPWDEKAFYWGSTKINFDYLLVGAEYRWNVLSLYKDESKSNQFKNIDDYVYRDEDKMREERRSYQLQG